ncbi:hypothetical protein N7468_008913 [Penicillium chermesinum]|uniref:N-acetyltransferase domain-containing protein n=1 Tax=Penicillium chermesinum TaxID=63820 RepID=A0A9W9TER8_9EURO|nr:uncharacterized protein N7468_008913 [Penicillium chermesinum]KAJ5219709.1 hypothetical protein N7468_008913 [Penicillium chermesinum]
MSPESPFKLEPLTVEDIPALTELWFAAFSSPQLRTAFPDTPGVRAWIAQNNLDSLQNRPFQKYIKVIDPATLDANGRPRLVAYAKWDLATQEERGDRFSAWAPEMPREILDPWFQAKEAMRRRLMQERKHVCADLDAVATHPDYQRRGAGAMLLQWGCDMADEMRLSAYVDASKEGAGLYAKFGFVDFSEPGAETASMARFID